MGLISNTTVYAKQNGGHYDFVIDGEFAMPTTPDFYRDLFANATRDPPAGLGASRAHVDSLGDLIAYPCRAFVWFYMRCE